MAGHLLEAGHRVAVYNRTRARADQLVEKGATWRDSPAEVAADAEVVFTMLGFPIDVREVVLGEDGILEVDAARLAAGRHDDQRTRARR